MAVMQLKDKETGKPIKDKQGRSWYFKTYFTPLSGERKQYKSKKYLNKKDAEEAERQFLNECDIASKGPSIKITLDELFNEYETYRTSKKNKDSSNYSDWCNYNNHISPFLGNKNITEINLLDIRNWHKYMDLKTHGKEEKPYSYKFKTKIHVLLSCILEYAKSIGYILDNVADRHGNFTYQNDEVIIEEDELIYQTPYEFERYINEVQELKWKVWFSFLYWNGCRKGEMQALTYEDIDFDNNLIRINKTLSNKIKGGGFKITNTKNRRNRKIAILSQLRPLLKEWVDYNKEYENFSEKWFLFGNTHYFSNTTIDEVKDYYYNVLNEKYPNEKITRLTTHQFGRHSHASLLISLGIPIEQIAERLGDTVEVIRKTYAHLFPTYNDNIISTVTDENIKKLNEKTKKYL